MLARNGLVDSFIDFGPPTVQQVLLFETLFYPVLAEEDVFASSSGMDLVDRLTEAGILRKVVLVPPGVTYDGGHGSMTGALQIEFERGAAIRDFRAALARRQINAIPVFRHARDWRYFDDVLSVQNAEQPKRECDVANVLIAAMPSPAPDVSWDAILELRRKPGNPA